MGNSPSQGGIEELERAESRPRDGSGAQRNSHRSQHRSGEGENDVKTKENVTFENASQAQGVSPMQVVNRIKANSKESPTSGRNKGCYNDPLNYRQSCSPPKDSFAEMQNVKPEIKTPFSELRSEFFNASEPVPWADSLIISNPLRVDGCSIFSADSLEQIQNVKSDDEEVFFSDSVQNLQLSKKVAPSETPTFSEATSSQTSDILLADESFAGGCCDHEVNVEEPVNKNEVSFVSNLKKESEPIKIQPPIHTLHDSIDLTSDEFSTLKETPIIDDVVDLVYNIQDFNPTATEIKKIEKTEKVKPEQENDDVFVDASHDIESEGNLASSKQDDDQNEKTRDSNENKLDSYPMAFKPLIITEEKAEIRSDSIFIKPLEENNAILNLHYESAAPALRNMETPVRDFIVNTETNGIIVDATSYDANESVEDVEHIDAVKSRDKHFDSNETVLVGDNFHEISISDVNPANHVCMQGEIHNDKSSVLLCQDFPKVGILTVEDKELVQRQPEAGALTANQISGLSLKKSELLSRTEKVDANLPNSEPDTVDDNKLQVLKSEVLTMTDELKVESAKLGILSIDEEETNVPQSEILSITENKFDFSDADIISRAEKELNQLKSEILSIAEKELLLPAAEYVSIDAGAMDSSKSEMPAMVESVDLHTPSIKKSDAMENTELIANPETLSITESISRNENSASLENKPATSSSDGMPLTSSDPFLSVSVAAKIPTDEQISCEFNQEDKNTFSTGRLEHMKETTDTDTTNLPACLHDISHQESTERNSVLMDHKNSELSISVEEISQDNLPIIKNLQAPNEIHVEVPITQPIHENNSTIDRGAHTTELEINKDTTEKIKGAPSITSDTITLRQTKSPVVFQLNTDNVCSSQEIIVTSKNQDNENATLEPLSKEECLIDFDISLDGKPLRLDIDPSVGIKEKPPVVPPQELDVTIKLIKDGEKCSATNAGVVGVDTSKEVVLNKENDITESCSEQRNITTIKKSIQEKVSSKEDLQSENLEVTVHENPSLSEDVSNATKEEAASSTTALTTAFDEKKILPIISITTDEELEEPTTPSSTAQGMMPKNKSTVSKTPINKRAAFSRKFVKNNLKHNDAFDCVEIFAPPSAKQVPLTETPLEPSHPSNVNEEKLTLEEQDGEGIHGDNYIPVSDKSEEPPAPEPPLPLPVKLIPLLHNTINEIPVVPQMNLNEGETRVVEQCEVINTSSSNNNNNAQTNEIVPCEKSCENIEENIPPSCETVLGSSAANPTVSEISSCSTPTANININSPYVTKTDLSGNLKTSSAEVHRESPNNTGAAKLVEVSNTAKTSMSNLSSHHKLVVNNATMPNNISKPLAFPYKVSIPQDEFKLNQHSQNEKCGMPSPSKGPTLCGKPPTTTSPVLKHSTASPAQGGSSWISGRSQQQFQQQPEEESTRPREKYSANKIAATIPISKKLLEHLAVNKIRDSQSSQDCVDYIGNSRNCIMSPSLSNNIYIDMNGIDAEALNALAAQEEQYLEQLQEKENLINELQQNLEQAKHKTEDGENFSRVLAEYEKTLALYVQQIDDLKLQLEKADEEKLAIMKDRDQAIEDLRNVESAFSDVHRKYERAKALLENLKKNEEILVRRDQDMMIKVENRERKLDTMREKVQENMEKMHQDYESKLREAEADNARLRAQFRKMEMKLSTLENDVEQKAKENAQLSALCDELINGEVIN